MADRCANCPYKGRAIDSQGQTDAKFAIVGEAPGAKEILRGIPFTGPTGKLLWDTLAKVGWKRGDPVFVTNAMSCRPTDKPPKHAAIQACHNRLMEELDAYPRDVILACGNSAMRSITGDRNFKITQERGKIRTHKGAKLVPTLHPANVLRDAGGYQKMKADFATALSLLKGDVQRNPGETKWTLVREENVSRVVDGLILRGGLVAADIETCGFNPRTKKVLALGVSYDRNKVIIFPDSVLNADSCREYFARLLSSTRLRWIWHNGKFDTAFLKAQYGWEARVDEDVMLIHYALCEIKGTHDLKQLSEDELGEQEDYEKIVKGHAKCRVKHDCAEEHGYKLVPRSILYPYLAKDCDYTLQLYHVFKPRLERSTKLVRLYDRHLIPASKFLQRVEDHGIWVDRERLALLRKRLEAEKLEATQKVWIVARQFWDPELYAKNVGAKKLPKFFNPASPKQIAWLLYDRLGFKIRGKARVGGPRSTNEEHLKLMPEHPVTAALLDLRGAAKALSTYVLAVEVKIDADGRIRTTYLIHGTVTGRLSSRNPNMQNQPREGGVRPIYAAPPGRTFVEADFDQAELRVLAAFSRDEFLVRCYREGRKLHHEVALEKYGAGYTGDQYIRAKAVNFGIAYGRTAHSIAAEFHITLSEAIGDVEGWFQRSPRAAQYLTACRNIPLTGKSIVTPYGRYRRFKLVTSQGLNEAQNEASNFPISSTASDLTLDAAMQAEPLLDEIDAQIVNLIHDSILVECDDTPEAILEVSRILVETMRRVPREVLGELVPFDAEIKIGTHWGEMEKTTLEKLIEGQKECNTMTMRSGSLVSVEA